jgi:magnesium transporter
MKRIIHSRTRKIGMGPGALVHIGDQKMERVVIQLIDYDDSGYFLEKQTEDVAELAAAIQSPSITWINVIGLHQVDFIKSIGETFDIHPLLVEDILNTDQRPRMEQFEKYMFLVLKMMHWDEAGSYIESEQLSIILAPTYVLTFQEQERDVFDPLRMRLREGLGRARTSGTDYLAYAILDLVVDRYFLILENLGDKIDVVEEELTELSSSDTLHHIHTLKRETLFLRKSVWPLRELLSGLQRGESGLFQQDTLIFLRDVYEHTIQVIDTVETFRDLTAGMLDIYLSTASNRMNEIMKILTVISTIFIPLTFITSLYGMNFHFMPELQWRWGYPLVWVIMLITAVTLLAFFRRREWL